MFVCQIAPNNTCFTISKISKSINFGSMIIRPKKIGLVKNFLSPTHPHKSNVYENIYFLFQKTCTQTKKFVLANLFVRIYVFSLHAIRDRALCFPTKKRKV